MFQHQQNCQASNRSNWSVVIPACFCSLLIGGAEHKQDFGHNFHLLIMKALNFMSLNGAAALGSISPSMQVQTGFHVSHNKV